ncbi:hypothetical protein VKI21_12470 [Cyanobacterium aponinum UTEX 3222]|uniref:hypothetical protein n=1 Tax=Cyanobacterium aponinum TaxID=379064 RepID=UPI001055E4D1|nr:hypothetical protein [Cyanobacterium aponinum]WRL38833.1 hypothetical protein VKI22_01675 [Cyanobacterium aponinum UTEX 3221]WRL40873.1 hypothetical protein VKI21_12470 [Cyanobacterium aponinum UTEX 3222]
MSNLIVNSQIAMIATELQRLNEHFSELYSNPDVINNDHDAQMLPEILNNISFCADQCQVVTQKIYVKE